MNSSSKTSTTLKSNRVSTGSPLSRLFKSKLLASVLFFGLLILLIKLGAWQLNRGYEKQDIEQQLILRQQLPSLTTQSLNQQKDFSELLGRQLTVLASPTTSPLIALDNQVNQGKVGYLIYQLMEVTPEQPALLVELGFIQANPDRSELPTVTAYQQQQFQGRLYYRESNPMSDQLYPEMGPMVRIQNLNIAQLSQYLQRALFPVVLQPETVAFDAQHKPLAKPWQPIPMPAKKHFGYAMQWFSMAIALFIIGIVLLKPIFTSFPVFSALKVSVKRSKDELSQNKK
nr:SURF1 family protein [Parashewanella hymeniacidonis]